MRQLASHALLVSLCRALFKLGSVYASPTVHSVKDHVAMLEEDVHGETPGSTAFWIKLLVSCLLVLAGGVFAGSVFLL